MLHFVKLHKADSICIVWLSLCTPFLLRCGGDNPTEDRTAFVKGETWLYQLQDGNIDNISNAGFDFAVIDYSSNGKESGEYTAQQLQSLADASVLGVAYISIGEAENYRFYWRPEWVLTESTNAFSDSAPAWLGRTDPDWQDNYKVRYWHADWRDNYLKPYLDKILAQGFCGVYLDIVDAFEYWGDAANYGAGKETVLPGDPINEQADAARHMIELVRWIASYCRAHSAVGEAFLVIPQNGVRILDYDIDGAYMTTVSGIGVEDVWYDETNRKTTESINERLPLLRRFVANDKLVLAVDYVDDGSGFAGANKERILDFAQICEAEGFRYYVAIADRELRMVNTIHGVQP